MTNNNNKSLESWIWDAACSIRGAKDAPKFKDYILSLIFTDVCLQLWHPTAQDIPKHLYFGPAQYCCGESEAPIILPDAASEYRARMEAILQSERHNIVASSTAGKAGIPAIDLVPKQV